MRYYVQQDRGMMGREDGAFHQGSDRFSASHHALVTNLVRLALAIKDVFESEGIVN